MNIRRTVVVTVGVVLIGLLGLGAYAFAQSDGFGPPWRNGGGWHGGDRGAWHGAHADPERVQQLRADVAGDLADELGTSPDDVEAAFRAVLAQRLAEAADAGRIDPDAVDEALAAYDEGDIGALVHVFKHSGEEETQRP